jgi:tRNA(Met) cytidine acetyltransferase
MELAARLQREASATDERRMLVLAGDPARTRDRAVDAITGAGIEPSSVRYVGPASLPYGTISQASTDSLLGTTHDAVVLDCHRTCRPNALGRVVGTVDGGGLLIFLTPPLGTWPRRRDEFDDTLAPPPFEPGDVAGHFRQRLVRLLRAHRGIAIVDVDTGKVRSDGLTDPAPRRPRSAPAVPDESAFPEAAYRHCLTRDQVEALAALETLREPDNAVVLEADRGRGKSSVVGLAAASLARAGQDVLVTAPDYRNARELFARAEALLSSQGAVTGKAPAQRPRQLTTEQGQIRFVCPAEAVELPGDPDRVLVDEAATLPVGLLEDLLAAEGLVFATTTYGYEGTGRGFSVRFRDRLAESELAVTDVSLTEPIRYAAGDPVEVWSFRALALDARPPVDPLVSTVAPERVSYRELTPSDLLADEHLLGEAFGLLVTAHYRTEPDDLARLLDAPNVTTHALTVDGHVVSVALVAREGGLSARDRARTYEGGRIQGNMLPDVLTSQLRDEEAGAPVGARVLRIATHSAARSRGLGSRLLSELKTRCETDWLGVAFGATPELVSFWRQNGFAAVHLATSRNDRSGEHSVVMLDPLTESGVTLADRHTTWLLRRLPATLTDPLSGVDPDVVRAVCRAIDGQPTLDLTDFEWRHVAGIPFGAAIQDTAPRSVRRLVVRYLVDSGPATADPVDEPAPDSADTPCRLLDPQQERLLVTKSLQAQDWDVATRRCSYDSATDCRRAFGRAVEPLVERYGTDLARNELARHQHD